MKKLVFRIPATALLAAGLIAICVTPVAWVAPGLQALYVLPLGYAYWVVRNRTTVTEDEIVARGLFATTTVRWPEVKAIRLVRKGWLKAVKDDDTEVTLPAVRFMHLPALSLVSGGRVPDPTAVDEETAEAVAAEDEAAEDVTATEDKDKAAGTTADVADEPVKSVESVESVESEK
ncbi:PH domain-containing protein [Lentzea xinjiangensis]|uniref:PH domain-containing protein n=1 Tax=Lentzea xinjiangensis TaxID=402600 RepID=A0A1H9PZI7_9PSEU|nr:PH domain-containing protein [Lentzea xinjiangensis]SER52983.1 PH domain-containing protein [Lentzea xinjiangensis]